jgi:hypothetical protein
LISELYLGGLYAIAGCLLIVQLLVVAVVTYGVAWLRGHHKGAVAWDKTGVETKLERE